MVMIPLLSGAEYWENIFTFLLNIMEEKTPNNRSVQLKKGKSNMAWIFEKIGNSHSDHLSKVLSLIFQASRLKGWLFFHFYYQHEGKPVSVLYKLICIVKLSYGIFWPLCYNFSGLFFIESLRLTGWQRSHKT